MSFWCRTLGFCWSAGFILIFRCCYGVSSSTSTKRSLHRCGCGSNFTILLTKHYCCLCEWCLCLVVVSEQPLRPKQEHRTYRSFAAGVHVYEKKHFVLYQFAFARRAANIIDLWNRQNLIYIIFLLVYLFKFKNVTSA